MSLDALFERKPDTWLQKLMQAPTSTLAKTLYSWRTSAIDSPMQPAVTVVCVSDTHNTQPRLPPGDILIHAGDLTQGGTAEELQTALGWLDRQAHEHKVVVAGNHDMILDSKKTPDQDGARAQLNWGSITYLQDSETTLKLAGGRAVTVYGSPWTRKHGNWAFQYEAGRDLFTGKVPPECDILVSHSPPRFHLDIADWGDEYLLCELWRVRPRLHVFGHLHAGYGRETIAFDRLQHLYEELVGGKAGTLALVQMACLALWNVLVRKAPSSTRTVLVNASAVGGLTDNIGWEVQVVRI